MWGMEKKMKKQKKKVRKATILSPRILEYKLIGASFSTICYF